MRNLPRSTAVLGPALCDHRLDAAFAKFPAMWFGVLAATGVNDFWLLKRPATDGTDGDAIGIDEDVALGTGSRAIRGLGPVFRAPQRLAPTMNRRPPARNRAGRPRVTLRAATRAAAPTRQPFASRAN